MQKAHLPWVATKRSYSRAYRRSIIRRRSRSYSYLARHLFESLSVSPANKNTPVWAYFYLLGDMVCKPVTSLLPAQDGSSLIPPRQQ